MHALFGTLERRKAQHSDVSYLLALRVRTMGPQYALAGLHPTENEHLEKVGANLQDCDILLESGEAIGMMKVVRRPGEWVLEQLQLEVGSQRKGVGSYLVKTLLRDAAAAGVSVTLKVLKVNPAFEMYRKLGFETYAESANGYSMRASRKQSESFLLSESEG